MNLPRTVKYRMTGIDVDGHGGAMHLYLQDGQFDEYKKQPEKVRQTFGVAKRTLAKKCAEKADLPQYGVVGPALFAKMFDAGAYTPRGSHLLKEYEESLKPKLIEPNQGWHSLDSSLWKVYSMGRSMGLSDLGTYNPQSVLPSGRKSDHAVYPAVAFDLGIDPDTGWNNIKARTYVQRAIRDPEVEYIILGSKIWTKWGLGNYYNGGHMNHIHVSGIR